MRILIAIVHHWNPRGSGRHQSLRDDPAPRIQALRESILAFSRLGQNQLHLHLGDQAAYAANLKHRHTIDLHVVTDGEHHVLDALDEPCRRRIQVVATKPPDPLWLGFEAHQHLADHLDGSYDLYAYFEDDLIVCDPHFFLKITQFVNFFGEQCVLLPQRFELLPIPAHIDKLYIDGALPPDALATLIPVPPGPVQCSDPWLGELRFESPQNPHAGCFVLTNSQLRHWIAQPWWMDRDVSFVSPLESAATLGLLKTFRLYKPVFAQANWLEAQHWGTSFFGLMARATTEPPTLHE
jgi:hypothetical protein